MKLLFCEVATLVTKANTNWLYDETSGFFYTAV